VLAYYKKTRDIQAPKLEREAVDMSDFVESAKNFVSSAVSRTSWEAQKQMRVRGKQGEVDKLLNQRQQLTNELTQVAMSLYIQGALHDAQLSRLCASILELDNDIKKHETQLQELKSESYPAEQFAPGPTTDYSPPPVNPSPVSPPPPASSARPNPQPRPGQQAPGAGASSQTTTCSNCGNPVRPGALYCRSCGAKQR
jgi:uncharacterized protein YdcH (DUF465 family)